MTRLAEIDAACEMFNFDDLQALAAGRSEGLSVSELCELVDRRIARRQERRVVKEAHRVRVKCLRERQKSEKQRPEAALVRDAWRSKHH